MSTYDDHKRDEAFDARQDRAAEARRVQALDEHNRIEDAKRPRQKYRIVKNMPDCNSHRFYRIERKREDDTWEHVEESTSSTLEEVEQKLDDIRTNRYQLEVIREVEI